jgi:hypothetical protein
MSAIYNRAAKHAALPLAACAVAALSALATPSASAQGQAQRIAIDPESGRARAPELEEMTATRAAAAAARAAAMTSGARSAASTEERAKPVAGARFSSKAFRVDPNRMSFTVVRRNDDGTIAQQCITGETAAQHAGHGAVVGGAHDH